MGGTKLCLIIVFPLHSPRLGRTAWDVPRLHYLLPRRNLLALQGNQCLIGFHLASSISPIIAFDVRLFHYVKELTLYKQVEHANISFGRTDAYLYLIILWGGRSRYGLQVANSLRSFLKRLLFSRTEVLMSNY